MKPLISTIFLLFGFLIVSELSGQDTFESMLGRYDSADQPDSAYLLIDKYEKQYTQNEQWDSLVYLLHQKGNLFLRYKSIQSVADVISNADKIADQYLDEENLIYLRYLEFKSDFTQDIGEYSESVKILDKIISISSKMEKDTTGVRESAVAEKAFLMLRLGRVKESMDLATSVYENIMKRGDTTQMVSVLQALTISNQWLNKYEDALKYNLENLDLIKQSFGAKHPNIGLMQSQMAGIYADKGQINKAIEYYNKAKEIHYHNYKSSGSTRFLSSTIGNIGDFYSTIGEHRLAIDHMVYSLELEQQEYGSDSWKNMWHYHVLSTASRLYGDYDLADLYIKKGFDLIAKSDQSTMYDHKLFSSLKAEMLYTRGRYDEALPLALEVYDYYIKNEEFGSTNNRLHVLNLITNIYQDNGEISKAIEWSRKNIQYHNENTHPLSSLRINVLINYLELLIKQNDTDQIYKIKNQILQLRNIGNGQYSLANVVPDDELLYFSSVWAKYLTQTFNDREKKIDEYFEFLEAFEAYYPLHLSTIKTNSNLAFNENYLKDIYAPAIDILIDKNKSEALLYTEKCKNFSTRQILQSQLIDDNNLPTLDYSLEDSPDLTNDNVPVDVFLTMAASLDSVSLYKDSLYKADRITYQKYFGIKDLTLSDIRRLIDKEELLVNFFIHDSTVFVFYISEDSIETKKYALQEIEKLIANVLQSNDIESNEILRELLFSDALLSNYSSIKILPDGKLTSLSFEQLLYKGKPLIYSKLISYGLSASILLYQEQLNNKSENRNQFLGLTPGFTKELKSKMNSLYSSNDSSYTYLLQQPFLLSLSETLSREFDGEIYEQLEASESSFKKRAQDFKILHIGTHGILNDDSPLFSKLIFAKDSLEDGYLHAYELYGKNLNADLAVLSACSSGKEKTYASEGIISLSHAFTHAGCPAVLMTKWDVDEKSTSIILEQFYKNLSKGMTKSESLRAAKLSFLEHSPAELHDPYYWAGLVLIGDDSAMFSRPWYKSPIILGVFFLIFIVGFLYKRKSRSKKV